MVFLFITVVLVILLVCRAIPLTKEKEYWGDPEMVIVVSLSFFAATSIGLVISGFTKYPELKARYEKVISLKKEIETIRNAYYKYPKNRGTIINGSLDNFKQSSALSEYIACYAKEKAEYNKSLEYYQTVRRLRVWRLFSYGAFISSDIEKLRKVH